MVGNPIETNKSSHDFCNFSKEIISTLLIDRTTGNNIIWATSDYSEYGIDEKSQIKLEQIYGEDAPIKLVPRCQKQKETQTGRTRKRAEVFTPSWVCNEMNNMIDEAWFDRKDVFSYADATNEKKWIATSGKIIFDTNIESEKNWQDYVNDTRLEITCGEAPFLVSRYDTVTGDAIGLENRIGLLDRKMRVVRENAENEADYFLWTEKAFQNIYGYEWCGDNIILARANLLLTFIDNTKAFLNREPTAEELVKFAKIISWNIWQMDGLTMRLPYAKGDRYPFKKEKKNKKQPSLFDELNDENVEDEKTLAIIYDWGENKPITFMSLIPENKNE